jgi:hypothetical protein
MLLFTVSYMLIFIKRWKSSIIFTSEYPHKRKCNCLGTLDIMTFRYATTYRMLYDYTCLRCLDNSFFSVTFLMVELEWVNGVSLYCHRKNEKNKQHDSAVKCCLATPQQRSLWENFGARWAVASSFVFSLQFFLLVCETVPTYFFHMFLIFMMRMQMNP